MMMERELKDTELYLASDCDPDDDYLPSHAEENDIVGDMPLGYDSRIATIVYARMVEGQTSEIAKRFVACWNAFDGVATEDIKPVLANK